MKITKKMVDEFERDAKNLGTKEALSSWTTKTVWAIDDHISILLDDLQDKIWKALDRVTPHE